MTIRRPKQRRVKSTGDDQKTPSLHDFGLSSKYVSTYVVGSEEPASGGQLTESL